jgi:hypothetical protein
VLLDNCQARLGEELNLCFAAAILLTRLAKPGQETFRGNLWIRVSAVHVSMSRPQEFGRVSAHLPMDG